MSLTHSHSTEHTHTVGPHSAHICYIDIHIKLSTSHKLQEKQTHLSRHILYCTIKSISGIVLFFFLQINSCSRCIIQKAWSSFKSSHREQLITDKAKTKKGTEVCWKFTWKCCFSGHMPTFCLPAVTDVQPSYRE